MAPAPVAIIINPAAGGAGPAVARARVELATAIAKGHAQPVEVFVTERPKHAHELADAAAHRGVRTIVAWGGDGTINEVASALAFNDTVAMGIVPAGSGNGFARALGIPRQPERALAAAMRGRARSIDLGELGGRMFVNVAGVGLDAHVAACFNAPENRVRGFAGYTLQTARALASYAPCHYLVVTDEERSSFRALFVAVANGSEFGNRIRIAPDARVDDGQLDLVVVEERSRLVTLWNMRRLVTGSIHGAPIWSSRRVQRATIECDAPMIFHVDEETVQGGARLEARVHPGALRIAF